MSRLHPLLAAIGSLFAIDPELAAKRRRHRAAPTAIDKAQSRAADRKRELDRLSLEDVRGCLTAPELERMQHLRLRRGKLARRLARRKPIRRGRKVVPDRRRPEQALHVDRGTPRALKREILRQEGKSYSPRQWRRFERAARRAERAS